VILTRYCADDPPIWANDPTLEEPIMITTRSHLIRAAGGRIRVLRLSVVGGHCYPLRYHAHLGEPGCCRVCGCTDRWACPGGCAWVNASHTLCSRCLEQELL